MIAVLEEGRSCVAIEDNPIFYIQSKVYVLDALDSGTCGDTTISGTPSTANNLEPESEEQATCSELAKESSTLQEN